MNVILELLKAELSMAMQLHDSPLSCLSQSLFYTQAPFLSFLPVLPDHPPASSTSFVAPTSFSASYRIPLPALLPFAQGPSQLLMMWVLSSSPFPLDLIFILFGWRDRPVRKPLSKY